MSKAASGLDARLPKVKSSGNGVEFPMYKGKRSTQGFGRECLAAALEPLSSEAARSARRERNWRWDYEKHFVRLVKLSCESSENAFKAAEAGLRYVHRNFEFVRGKAMSVEAGMQCSTRSFHTATVKGTAKPSFSISYHGNTYEGARVISLAREWARRKVVEPDVVNSLEYFMSMTDEARKAFFDEHYICVLGAGSAVGPYEILMRMGATVVAVDLNRQRVWKRLVKIARKSAGTLIFPVTRPQAELKKDRQLFACAGADLITQTPELANWLSESFLDRQLVVGSYAYARGDFFVRVVVAMDAIVNRIVETVKRHGGRLPALAHLCTPTNVHVVTEAAYHESQRALKNVASWQHLLRKSSNFCKPASELPPVQSTTGKLFVQSHISDVQGPNYALAKRIQLWRAIVARRDGCTVSCNVAPTTETVSVTQNRLIAMGLKGSVHFPPNEVFPQKTTNSLMTALLLNDLTNPASCANPATPLAHPMVIETKNACHGGCQRGAFSLGSVGHPAAAVYAASHPLALSAYGAAMLGGAYVYSKL